MNVGSSSEPLELRELPAPEYSTPTELPHGITAAWLTKLLYDGNHLDDDSGVIVATVDRITDIYCDNGVVYKLEVTYGGPRRQSLADTGQGLPDEGLPGAFILKLYDDDKLLRNAKRELLFYSALAAKTPVRTPVCYWSKVRPQDCVAAPRCPKERWPSLEDFLAEERWCGFPTTPEPLGPDGVPYSESDASETMSESAWSESAWSESSFGGTPRPRLSKVDRYAKLLRGVGIHSVGSFQQVRNNHKAWLKRYGGVLEQKGMKNDDIARILVSSQPLQPRSVYAALLLEDVAGGAAKAKAATDVIPEDHPAAISLQETAAVAGAMAQVHAAWWADPALQAVQSSMLGTRQYNTNAPDWLLSLEGAWPALSRYVHKFSKLAQKFPTADEVLELASRPLTLAHGDLHRANLVPLDDGVVIYDWAEINVCSGPEELAQFLVRSRIWSEGTRVDKRDIVRPILQHYYRTLTRSGVSSLTYPYSAFEDHLVLGMLGAAAASVKHLEELRAKHVMGATPFGAPRWLLEKLKDVLSLAAFVCKKA